MSRGMSLSSSDDEGRRVGRAGEQSAGAASWESLLDQTFWARGPSAQDEAIFDLRHAHRMLSMWRTPWDKRFAYGEMMRYIEARL